MSRVSSETTSRAKRLAWLETLLQWQDRIGVRGLAAAMLIAVTVVILASFIRTPSAEFGLSAKVDGLTLETSAPIELEDLISASVDIAGIQSSRWSSEQGMIVKAVDRLRVEAAGGVVTLSRMRIPKGWSITLETEGSGRQRVLANPGLSAAHSAAASLTLAVPKGSQIKIVDTDNAQTERTTDADEEDIFLTLGRVDASLSLPSGRRDIARWLRIAAMTLSHYDTDETGTASAELFETGSIRSGSLWIGHVAGPPRDLGLLDRISITGIERGAASLVLESGLWEVRARGVASEITNKPGDASDSLKPDVLTVFRDNGMLKACVAVISFLAGIKISSRKERARN